MKSVKVVPVGELGYFEIDAMLRGKIEVERRVIDIVNYVRIWSVYELANKSPEFLVDGTHRDQP